MGLADFASRVDFAGLDRFGGDSGVLGLGFGGIGDETVGLVGLVGFAGCLQACYPLGRVELVARNQ
jgi:hypothetical protein